MNAGAERDLPVAASVGERPVALWLVHANRELWHLQARTPKLASEVVCPYGLKAPRNWPLAEQFRDDVRQPRLDLRFKTHIFSELALPLIAMGHLGGMEIAKAPRGSFDPISFD